MNDFFTAVAKIELLNKEDKTVSYGTGFFYAIPIEISNQSEINLPCLITTKHLLDNPDYCKYKITIQNINDYLVETTNLEIVFTETDVEVITNDYKDLALIYLKNVNLRKNRNFLRPVYLKYPVNDLWIMHNFLGAENIPYGQDIFGNKKKPNLQNDSVLIIGYHYGDSKYGINHPISIYGSITMDISKGIFIIQAPVSKGSSGSPIFAQTDGGIQLVGLVSEQCSSDERNINGLFYAVSSQGINLMEQSLIEKIGENEIKRKRDSFKISMSPQLFKKM